MYKNDNEKKYFFLAMIFAMIALTLVSCGKRAVTRAAADDVAWDVCMGAGWMSDSVWQSRVTGEGAYCLGLSPEQLDEMAEEAVELRPDELDSARGLFIIKARSESDAAAIYAIMSEDYQWAPCDPARLAAIARCGEYVLLIRGGEEDTNAALTAFKARVYGKAEVYRTKNPM